MIDTKEKAQEFVNYFARYGLDLIDCKKAALFVIDAIIDSNCDFAYSGNVWGNNQTFHDCEKHWDEIRKHIEL